MMALLEDVTGTSLAFRDDATELMFVLDGPRLTPQGVKGTVTVKHKGQIVGRDLLLLAARDKRLRLAKAVAGATGQAVEEVEVLLLNLDDLAGAKLSELRDDTSSSRPLNEDEEVAALALLDDPDLWGRIGAVIVEGGWAGDTTPPLLAYMGLTSRVYKRPMNLSFIAASASGKSAAVDAAKHLFPETAYHWIGASSERALIYDEDGDYKHKIVIVAEADSLPDEGPAASAIRALASENEMRYDVVEQEGGTGSFHTRHIVKPGPTGLITTSTEPLDPQMATRMLMVAVSETPEQTQVILFSQAASANGTQPNPPDVSVLRALQRWLELYGDSDVSIPYSMQLADKVPVGLVRVRRDFPQLLALIAAFAILHQRQRERDEAGRVVAALDDYRMARELLLAVFAETTSGGVSNAVRETVEGVSSLYDTEPVSVSALAHVLGLHRSTVYRRVNTAVDLDLLVNTEERKGRPARLILGAPLPENRPALPEVEEIKAYLHPETDATVQPVTSEPTYIVPDEAVAEAVATTDPVAQPDEAVADRLQTLLQPVKETDLDTNTALNGRPVARLQSIPGESKDISSSCSECGTELSVLNKSGLCGRCVANAANPEEAARAKLLELAEDQGWPTFVQYRHPSGRDEGLHNGQEHHWRSWVKKEKAAVLTAVIEALEAGETA